MGVSLAAACRGDTSWVSTGRSPATTERAASAGMRDVGTIEALAEHCAVIVSICPPRAALAVADLVATTGFDGIYVDANAVAPDTARRISSRFSKFVDGSVIGPPVRRAGTTRLYLSGAGAAEVADRWDGSNLAAHVIDGGPGAASALKMTYAGWTKGTTALLFGLRALAEAEGVGDALLAEWAISQPELAERLRSSTASAGPKAWRWAGEMEEIAAAFAATELPDGFHRAAADIYERLAGFKDADPGPATDAVVSALLEAGDTET